MTSPVGVTGPVAGFLPWIIFWVIASPSTWEYAVVAALLAVLILAIPDVLEVHKLKILDIGTIVFFGVLTILGLILDRSTLDWLEEYAQAISSAALGLITLTSLVIGMPFTEQYAREMAPREVWGDPIFRQSNRVLTSMWTAIFLITAVLGAIGVGESGGLRSWLEWILPTVLLVGGFSFQGWFLKRQRGRRARAEGPRA